MKIVLKYLWSLMLLPLLIFVKGDFSVDTYMSVNQIEPISITREKVLEDLNPVVKPILTVKVKIISKSGQFSADGFAADLYDDNYNLISQSQIMHSRIQFTLDKGEDTLKNYTVVIPKTADELTFDGSGKRQELVVNEEHLLDIK